MTLACVHTHHASACKLPPQVMQKPPKAFHSSGVCALVLCTAGLGAGELPCDLAGLFVNALLDALPACACHPFHAVGGGGGAGCHIISITPGLHGEQGE